MQQTLIRWKLWACLGFPGDSVVENLPRKQEMWVQFQGWEDPLEKEMVIPLVLLPGKSHGQRSLLGYSLWDQKSIRHDLVTK